MNCQDTGAEIKVSKVLRSETPKASRDVGNGEGYPLRYPPPQPSRRLEKRRKLPSLVLRPTENDLYRFLHVAYSLLLRICMRFLFRSSKVPRNAN